MKKKLIWIGVGLVALLLIVGGILIATFKIPEFKGIVNFEVLELEGKELHAQVSGQVYNGNFYSLSARNLEYLVTYHDTLLGKGKLPEGISLAGGDSTLLELPFTLELQAIFALHKSMLRQSKCKLDIHLVGDFTQLHVTRGFDITMEVDPKQLLKDVLGHSMGDSPIKIEELTWKGGDLKQSSFSFVSVVKNPLDLDLELKTMVLAFFVEGNQADTAGHWQLDKPVALKPQYGTRVPGTVQIQNIEAGKGIVKTIFTGEIRYPARGLLTLQLANLTFEVPLEGTVVLDPKSGKGRWE